MLLNQVYVSFFILLCTTVTAFITYLHFCFFTTGITISQKDKIVKVYKNKWLNAITIKYRDSKNRTKLRRIMLPAVKFDRESALQLLEEYKILQ